MKLLRNFFRLRGAGALAAFGRGAVTSREYRVTVPAPLPAAADAPVVVVDLSRAIEASATAPRREPASFLKACRHRRRGSSR